MAQHLIVALLVGCCGVYALWTLAPKGLRRRVALRLMQLPLPRRLQRPLIEASQQQGGCGCDGCGASVQTTLAQPALQPMVFVPRKASGSAPRAQP